MFNKSFALALATVLSLLSACGSNNKNGLSNLDGHFESSSAAALNKATGGQRATAEWEPSRGVILSAPLITSFNKTQMAAAIADSGIDKLWILVPSNFRGTVETSPSFAGLRQALGSNLSKVELIRQQLTGSLTVWSRDWAPQGALTASGDLRLLDFNYFPGRDADDYTGQSMEHVLNFPRVSVPIYNEGGNFMTTTDGNCLMTSRVTDGNGTKERADDIVMDAEGVKSYYEGAAGCKTVNILPRMPYEGTGHIDMWAKFLDNKTVIVNELRDEDLSLYTNAQALARAKVIKKYFDARAADIKALGYTVIRIPVPGAIFQNGQEVYRSYTNSLAVNGNIIVPRYVAPNTPDVAADNGLYFDQSLLPKYEEEVRSVYEKAGYKFTWVVSDDLIYVGGAVHCTTMQVPR
ncbi:MAG: agmatine deiminase family protein [Chitinophagaceae bacterium]|nr:agmatine deiminase family protein [Oligoflexus sp.]